MLELNQSAITFLNTAAAICEKYAEGCGADVKATGLDYTIVQYARDLQFEDLSAELGWLSAEELCGKVAWKLRDIADAAQSSNRYRN
jgi:hypothetical protein